MIKSQSDIINKPIRTIVKREYYCDVCKKLILIEDVENINCNDTRKQIVTFSSFSKEYDCCSPACFDKVFSKHKINLFKEECEYRIDTTVIYGYKPAKNEIDEPPTILGVEN